jgi:hypothetical protein
MKLHFISLLTLLLSLPSGGTSFHVGSFEEFTGKVPTIVRGTVKNIRVEKSTSADGQITIYTTATLEVKEHLKGASGKSEIRIRKVGGELEGYHLEIPGSPEFKENEDTVLYLGSEQEDGSFEIEGLELGKFGLKTQNGTEVLIGGVFDFMRKKGSPPPEAKTLSDLRALLARTTPPASPVPPPAASASPGTTPAAMRPEGTPGPSDAPPPAPGEERRLIHPLALGVGAVVLIALFLRSRRRK